MLGECPRRRACPLRARCTGAEVNDGQLLGVAASMATQADAMSHLGSSEAFDQRGRSPDRSAANQTSDGVTSANRLGETQLRLPPYGVASHGQQKDKDEREQDPHLLLVR
ncbi:hypothetical protein GCM10029963_75080 [Micromonospora andamanensis]|nr:hypothetical protein Vwe01_45020 [Micromonospora andamanensis]